MESAFTDKESSRAEEEDERIELDGPLWVSTDSLVMSGLLLQVTTPSEISSERYLKIQITVENNTA